MNDGSWIPSPGLRIASRLIGGRAILLDPREDKVRRLNSVGSFVWSLISERRHTLAELAEAVTTEFDVDAQTAADDVEGFVRELTVSGFLASRSSESGGGIG